jgi:aminoglycoside phosphotransferase (APT) family kinase protein
MIQRGFWHPEHGTKSFGPRVPGHGPVAEHKRILEELAKLMPHLADAPVLQAYAAPVLWHWDLHMGNIFVAEHDPRVIVSIIDWQFAAVLPQFVQ